MPATVSVTPVDSVLRFSQVIPPLKLLRRREPENRIWS
jgi:hypothetical protein